MNIDGAFPGETELKAIQLCYDFPVHIYTIQHGAFEPKKVYASDEDMFL